MTEVKSIPPMTRTEKSLLLYLECRAVDHGGLCLGANMNAEDLVIAKRWNEEGFIQFGRIVFHEIDGMLTHWVQLSDAAWTAAHLLRRERGLQIHELVRTKGGRELE